MSVPEPSRIRLFAPTDRHKRKPVGHWFLRPDRLADPAEERWKLSVWYPECEIWGPNRRRLDGSGWMAGSEAFADSFRQIALDRYQAFERNDQRLQQMIETGQSLGPGYRPQYTRKLRTQHRNSFRQFRCWLVDAADQYLKFVIDNGWPQPPIRGWPWDD